MNPSDPAPRSDTDSALHRDSGIEGLNESERVLTCRPPEACEATEPTPTYADCPDTTLPFGDYIAASVKFVQDGFEDGTIFEWQSGVFHLVRYLRAHPESAKWKPMPLIKAMKKGRLEWMPDPDKDRDEAEAEFVRHWDKIRFLPGATPIESASQRSIEQPLKLDKATMENRPEKYERFISLVGWLAATVGKPEVALPCKEIGERLGLTKMTVSTYRGFAVEDGFLVQLSGHRLPSKGKKGAATVFRFAVERFQVIQDAIENAPRE